MVRTSTMTWVSPSKLHSDETVFFFVDFMNLLLIERSSGGGCSVRSVQV